MVFARLFNRKGMLEDVLVEELAFATWRQRRLIMAERAEIQRAIEFVDPASDSGVLTQLYGEPSDDKWQRTVFDSYLEWLATAQCSEKERQQQGYAAPEECEKRFLSDLAAETKRLQNYRKAFSSVEAERRRLEGLRHAFR
jgi:hypothetical protein